MKLFFFSAFLCLSVCAHAQLHWAVKAGAQISGARYNRNGASVPVSNVVGFNAGLQTKVYIDNKVAFVSGLQYNARGFTVKTLPGDTEKTYRLNYIDLPLLIQVDLSPQAGTGFFVQAGPQLSAGVSGKENYTGMNGVAVHNRAVMSVTGNHFGLFDATLHGGIGYAFPNKLFVQFSYDYGIGNINNDQTGPNIKSRVAALNIGYYFR